MELEGVHVASGRHGAAQAVRQAAAARAALQHHAAGAQVQVGAHLRGVTVRSSFGMQNSGK